MGGVVTQTLPENKRTAGEGEGYCWELRESKLEMLVFTVTWHRSPGCSQTQYIAGDDSVAFPF